VWSHNARFNRNSFNSSVIVINDGDAVKGLGLQSRSSNSSPNRFRDYNNHTDELWIWISSIDILRPAPPLFSYKITLAVEYIDTHLKIKKKFSLLSFYCPKGGGGSFTTASWVRTTAEYVTITQTRIGHMCNITNLCENLNYHTRWKSRGTLLR